MIFARTATTQLSQSSSPPRAIRWLATWTFGFGLLFAPQVAWAQAQPPTQGHSDVMAYVLIVFCVALGMIILLRSAGRTSEVRLEDLDDE
jgi:hypothetical protein